MPFILFAISISLSATPEPAINFRVTATTSTTMSLAWENQFHGLLTITGGALEYFTGGSSPTDMTVSGTTATLTSLTPFAFYNVTLFVTNRLGRSTPVSLVQQTDSNCEFCLDCFVWLWIFVCFWHWVCFHSSLLCCSRWYKKANLFFYCPCNLCILIPSKNCCLM